MRGNVELTDICARCANFYTPAVSDALDRRGIFSQVLPKEMLPLRDDMVVAGIAFTCKV